MAIWLWFGKKEKENQEEKTDNRRTKALGKGFEAKRNEIRSGNKKPARSAKRPEMVRLTPNKRNVEKLVALSMGEREVTFRIKEQTRALEAKRRALRYSAQSFAYRMNVISARHEAPAMDIVRRQTRENPQIRQIKDNNEYIIAQAKERSMFVLSKRTQQPAVPQGVDLDKLRGIGNNQPTRPTRIIPMNNINQKDIQEKMLQRA